MSEAVMDVAALESAVDSSAIETPQETSTEVAEQGSQSAPEQTTNEGAAETEPKQETKTETTKESGPALPKSIAATLKALAEDPNNPDAKSAAKTLKESFFSEQAYKQTFGSVKEAREAKTLLSEIAGGSTDLKTVREAWENNKSTMEQIAESDALLYEGSPQIVANVVEDLKSEGRIEALGKLTGRFLEAVKAEDPEAFVGLHRGLLVEGLYEVGFPQGINALSAALKNGDVAQAKSIVRSIVRWFSDEQNSDKDHKALSQAQSQRTESEKKASEAKYQVLSNEVAKPIDSLSNVALGKELRNFLLTDVGKSLNREALEDLARSVKSACNERLEADKAYGKEIERLLRSGQKEQAVEFHRTTVSKIAKSIVDKVTNIRYPKAKAAIVATKASAPTRAKTTASSGEYVYVSQRPTREQMDMTKTKDMDLVLGRATLRDGRRVTWRENHRIATKD